MLISLSGCCINIPTNARLCERYIIITCFLSLDAFDAIISYMYSFIFLPYPVVFCPIRALTQCLLFRLHLSTL